MALTEMVQSGEIENISKTFKNPSPFTVKSVRMAPAPSVGSSEVMIRLLQVSSKMCVGAQDGARSIQVW